MNPADEMAAKKEPTERQSAGAAAGFDDELNQQLRAVVEQLRQPKPLDEPERDDLRPGITSYLDHEASERKAIYDRLVAIENEVKRRGSRRRYLVAILIVVAATLAWQSYDLATLRQTVQQLAQTAPTAPSIDPEKVEQMTRDLATLRQTVEQLATGQEQVTQKIGKLEVADMEILAKITPAPAPPRPIAAPARKPTPTAPPTSRAQKPPPHP